MANILIVDDDRDILRMLEFALKRAGHVAITTTSGKEGLELVRNDPPHLIIADVMMPEMTGYEFTRQVRAAPNGSELPILVYSARFQDVDRRTALEAGATDYMPKSIAPSELVDRINSLLGDASAEPEPATGRLLAVYSLQGGAGTTAVAVNLAVVLAYTHRTPICLADLNPMAGHASLMLKLRPQADLEGLMTQESQALTSEVLPGYLTAHPSGVKLLASPLLSTEERPHHRMSDLTHLLRSEFRFTVMDLPHMLPRTMYSVIPEITRLVLLISPVVPALQSAVAALKYLQRHGLPPERILPVVNSNSPAPGLSISAIQKTIGLPIAAEIPFEPNMTAAVTEGQPLVLNQPKSPTSRALAQLAVKLVQ